MRIRKIPTENSALVGQVILNLALSGQLKPGPSAATLARAEQINADFDAWRAGVKPAPPRPTSLEYELSDGAIQEGLPYYGD